MRCPPLECHSAHEVATIIASTMAWHEGTVCMSTLDEFEDGALAVQLQQKLFDQLEAGHWGKAHERCA